MKLAWRKEINSTPGSLILIFRMKVFCLLVLCVFWFTWAPLCHKCLGPSDTSQCGALVIEIFMHSAPALVSQWSKDVVPCSACCKDEWLISRTQIRFKVLNFLSAAARVLKYFQGSQDGLVCLKCKPCARFCVSRCQHRWPVQGNAV